MEREKPYSENSIKTSYSFFLIFDNSFGRYFYNGPLYLRTELRIIRERRRRITCTGFDFLKFPFADFSTRSASKASFSESRCQEIMGVTKRVP